MKLEIQKASVLQTTELLTLYRKVAARSDGIIRRSEEINESYITDFQRRSISNGLILLGLLEGEIVGEIHAYTPPIHAFQHILTDLTIVVDPAQQGKGIGRRLFDSFLNTVTTDLTHIKRVELYTREHNTRNVNFYQSLGFVNEGRQADKIFVSESQFETPLHMAWFNPNYGGPKP